VNLHRLTGYIEGAGASAPSVRARRPSGVCPSGIANGVQDFFFLTSEGGWIVE
jgi:hypothetical protein